MRYTPDNGWGLPPKHAEHVRRICTALDPDAETIERGGFGWPPPLTPRDVAEAAAVRFTYETPWPESGLSATDAILRHMADGAVHTFDEIAAACGLNRVYVSLLLRTAGLPVVCLGRQSGPGKSHPSLWRLQEARE